MSDYDYPPDEFDQPAEPGQSVGIHRAPQSSWSKVWPYLVVIVVFAALAYGLVMWFASQNPSSGPSKPTATTSQAPEPSGTESSPEETSQEPSEDPSDDESEPAPDDSETATEPEESPSDDETTAALDRSTPIRVLNSTTRAGLAASAAGKLNTAGWTAAIAANYSGGDMAASAVWFKDEENRDEAEQIARDLGISDVSLQPTLVGPISVILAADYTG